MAFTVFRRFFGGAVNTASGYAIGGAMQPALDPLTQDLANRTWALHPDRPVDPALLANAVAQGQIVRQVGKDEAAFSGISGERFDQLVQVFDTGPGVAQAFELWRRNLIDDAGFKRAVKREGIEDEWIADLMGLKSVLLTPAELANAVVQGHRDFAAAAADADLQGVTQENFQTMVDNTGLPPGPETLLEWQRRGILTPDEVAQGIREGHTKVKYIPKYEQALHPVLSHTTYAGLRLRGWITAAESYAGGALTGYTQEQMDQEFLNRGRPATAHQIHIGYARGAKLAGAADEEAAIRKAIQQSDIRPEYADLIFAGRYTLPSVFALRGLVQSGAVTQAEGEAILLQSGWRPDLAKSVAEFWAHPANVGATVNPRLKRAQDQVYNATHSTYLDNEIDRAQAIATLAKIGLTEAIAGQVVDFWEIENEVLVKPLTPSAVKKIYKENTITIDDAVARLVAQQWDAANAKLYLQS